MVGHSWGGAIATAFAIRHPAMTAGLVLLAPTSHPWDGGISWYYTLATTPVIGPLFVHTHGDAARRAADGQCDRSGVFDPQTPPARYVARSATLLVLRPSAFVANAQDVASSRPISNRWCRSIRSIRRRPSSSPVTAIVTVSNDIHAAALAAADPRTRGSKSCRVSGTCRITRGRTASLAAVAGGCGADRTAGAWCSRELNELALLAARPDPATHERDAQHVGRAGRAERHAGDDDDALAGLGEAVRERDPAGALHHVVLVVRVLGDDAMHAPDQRQFAPGRDVRRDRDDRRLRPFARDAQGRSSRKTSSRRWPRDRASRRSGAPRRRSRRRRSLPARRAARG